MDSTRRTRNHTELPEMDSSFEFAEKTIKISDTERIKKPKKGRIFEAKKEVALLSVVNYNPQLSMGQEELNIFKDLLFKGNQFDNSKRFMTILLEMTRILIQ
jgi:hypothetical protein